MDYRTLAEGEVVDLMSALVTPVMMNHTVLSYGYLVQADNRRLFYTGDHEPFENIYQPG